jgi:hypothetical protein
MDERKLPMCDYSLKNNIKPNDKIKSPVIDLAYFDIRQNNLQENQIFTPY